MSLWEWMNIPYLFQIEPRSIKVEDMTHWFMQGVDKKFRPYLATLVHHEGELKVGFIIQRYSDRTDEYEYGLLGKMDIWIKPYSEPLTESNVQIIRIGIND